MCERILDVVPRFKRGCREALALLLERCVRSNVPPDVLSFLIDECLHTSLVEIANGMGYTAYHIEHLGLKGAPDWQLWKRALQDDLIFVTNNAQDFRKLYRRAGLHPGLVLILPMVRPEVQRQLFRAGLEYIADRTNITNRLVEIDLRREKVNIQEFELP
jgi:predicted nuclease of predicted toxin-antitoxin system